LAGSVIIRATRFSTHSDRFVILRMLIHRFTVQPAVLLVVRLIVQLIIEQLIVRLPGAHASRRVCVPRPDASPMRGAF
jgi:hypothetical protein